MKVLDSVREALVKRSVGWRWWRNHPAYRSEANVLSTTSRMSRDELAEFRFRRLSGIVSWAAKHSPYYRRVLEIKDKEYRLTSPGDFSGFPILDKGTVISEKNNLRAQVLFPLGVYQGATGGSSGEQVVFCLSRESWLREWAHIEAGMRRFGWKPGMRKLTIRGAAVAGPDQGRYWRFKPEHREMLISPFYLGPKEAPLVESAVRRFRPQFIQGFPSAIRLYLRECGIEGLTDVRGVLLTSEACTTDQRAEIRDALGVEPFTFWGHSERGGIAWEYPGYEGLFSDARYGYVEEVEGQILVTGFLNRAQPLLRYRLGDFGRVIASEYSPSGCLERLVDLRSGRDPNDSLRNELGQSIGMAALELHGSRLVDSGLRSLQYHQDVEGYVTILYSCSQGELVDGDLEEMLLESHRKRMGKGFVWNAKRVASPRRTKSGKMPVILTGDLDRYR